MRGNLRDQNPSLKQTFARHRAEIHDLEPGNSMLLGYPGSVYGHGVFLLTGMKEEGFTGLHVNGERSGWLSVLAQKQFNTEIPKDMDLPIMSGGQFRDNNMFIVAPHDWHPEFTDIEAGPYRIHYQMPSIEAIIAGDRPDRVRLFCGMITGAMGEFHAAMQDNQLGEIAVAEDILFKDYDAETKWQRAMNIHTGGRNTLFIPQAYDPPSLLVMPGAEAAKPHAPRVN